MTISVWRAPGRVNLIGEHTDYNGGFALPLAIAQGCTATVALDTGGQIRLSSAQRRNDTVVTPLAGLAPGRVEGWAAYAAGIVWALNERGVLPDLDGLTVHVDSDVPGGAGLSSSAALICAVAAAVDDLLDLGLSRPDLVSLTQHTENDFVGAPTGGMDQMASLLCEADHALLCDMRSLQTESVPFDLDAAGLSLLITDTHAPHRHADGEYRARRESCEKAAEILGVSALRDITLDDLQVALAALPSDELRRRTRHIVTENQRVLDTADLLRAGRLGDIGGLLTASHHSMRDDYEITVPEVDTAFEALLAAGALGARMTGGGFGGCVIALMAPAQVRQAQAAVRAAFAEAGFTPPGFFTARASSGAAPVIS